MSYITGFAGQMNPALSAVILNTATKTGAISTGGLTFCGVHLPAAFTGTTLTFEAAEAVGGTYKPVYNSAGLVSYTVAAGRYIAIDPKDFHGIAFLKIVSGSAEAADRTLICSMKGL